MQSLMHASEKLNCSPALPILSLVLRHALNSGASPAEYGHHLRRIQSFVIRQEPIELVLPAFPAKSPNPEKTIGPLPDLAEVLGLERLQKTCDEISGIYAPGARVVICSDGRVFSDLVLVSDAHVSAYSQAIGEIISELGLRSLSTFDLQHIFPSRDFEAMRAELVKTHAHSLDQIRAAVLADPGARAMFNGIHRFIFEDRAVLFPKVSRSRLREESKDIAYKVIQRSNAWSTLVEKNFPRAVRLSIHPQLPASAKLGFRLVPSENAWGTPWHNVACLGPAGFCLLKKKDAESRGAKPAVARGKYAYYLMEGLTL